ncbi:MAG: ATP-binding cassette domain-containing protein [Hyphomonadaceae bacterium]
MTIRRPRLFGLLDLGNWAWIFRALFRSRPVIEPQAGHSDCGYLCVSALLALLGQRKSVAEIKAIAGGTTRGLTLKQLRDVLIRCGAEADAIFFDRKRAEAFPCPGIVLLERGHYVAIVDATSDRFEIFDPQIGWAWVHRRGLARKVNGLGVAVRAGLSQQRLDDRTRQETSEARSARAALARLFLNRVGLRALVIFAIAQSITLVLPLLSMWSVDSVTAGLSLNWVGVVGIGFVALSATNTMTTLVGDLWHYRLNRSATRSLGHRMFDRLAAKSPGWFDSLQPATVQNKANSLQAQLDFASEAFRALGGLAITFTAGLLALLYISPWLALPGLCSLALSIATELAFNKSQLAYISSALEATQRRQAFVLDTISQMPLIARFGALTRARAHFGVLIGRAAVADAKLKSLRSWRNLVTGTVKASETLIFASFAAFLMAEGNYTLGGFVALGAYKDLLAGAMASAFQLRQRYRALETHRLQSNDLLADATQPSALRRLVVQAGHVAVRGVSFQYGSLDKAILHDLTFDAQPGQCSIIRGASGAGKSTLAKLIAGVLTPTHGRVLIDGQPPQTVMDGFAAVLQSDRLIAGSIKDNITMYRADVSDAEVRKALRLAELEDFVDSLPMRSNTWVAEGTSGLSGGQRQRLLIARAALRHPRLVLLDEATSSLEVEIEARILQSWIATGCTLIVISHRPEVWSFADQVVTFTDNGSVSTAAVEHRCAPTASTS